MKRIKKWLFLWIVAVVGVVFLTVTESWKLLYTRYSQAGSLFPEGFGKQGSAVHAEAVANSYDAQALWTAQSEGEAETVGAGEAGTGNSGSEGTANGGGAEAGSGRTGAEDREHGETGTGNAGSVNPGTGDTGNGGNGKPGEETLTARSPEEAEYVYSEDDYFADAVFIGDSRTVGLYEYGGLAEIATFYATSGLTVYSLFDTKVEAEEGASKGKKTIEEALRERQFAKIYLMVGINEMGRGTVDTFLEKYREVVARLRELSPDAVIFLQGILKVTAARSDKGDYIHNPGIEARNQGIAGLADYVKIYYLDVNSVICDDTGGMNPSYTFDGVHLKAKYILLWKDFLKEHTVVLDRFSQGGYDKNGKFETIKTRKDE
ncbi:MAG: GDSL-type esterase/lipase family protein [Clostridium sp.]|jgi:lysophospholipase L1-like esterase|nr:GDSL-type esterase/lipase family protein [Clostridium sp.]